MHVWTAAHACCCRGALLYSAAVSARSLCRRPTRRSYALRACSGALLAGPKAWPSFMFAACCWCRLLAVDGCPGAPRGHALGVRRPTSQRVGATARASVFQGCPNPSSQMMCGRCAMVRPAVASRWLSLLLSPLLSACVTRRLDGSGSRRQRPVSFSQLSRVRRRLARKGPSVGGASIADTPGWDVPVTKSSRGRQGRSNQQVRPLRAVALRPAWRGGLGSSACRRRGLVRIDRHGSWVAPVAVCRRQCLV